MLESIKRLLTILASSYQSYKFKSLAVIIFVLFQGCTSDVPEGIEPVKNFDINKYMGTWYEIARLNHSFEKGFDKVTANYQRMPNGTIRVENSGLEGKRNKRKVMVGKAKFAGSDQVGHLKVQFLPFLSGTYVVFYIEPDYSVALVCGHNKNYCWILARKPKISQADLDKYLKILKENGFATEKMIFSYSS